MRDLHNNIRAGTVISPRVVASNALIRGYFVDMQGFESLEFILEAGALSDGVYTPSLTEGDDPAVMTPVAAGDLLGSIAAATLAAASDSNRVKRLGYRGTRRWVQLSLTPSGVHAGGQVGVIAVQADARNRPVPASEGVGTSALLNLGLLDSGPLLVALGIA